MKKSFIGTWLLVVFMTGCQLQESVSPEVIICPAPYQITRDSIETGSYLGLAITEAADNAYSTIQTLRQTQGVTYLNVVSNVFSDLTQLKERLPLYEYILLDQRQGTESGIQIYVEGQTVTKIFLNNGEKLNQWPSKLQASSSVRVGDNVAALYEKLVNIKGISSYTNKFERISLLTKNLSTPYDKGMAQAPYWYFTYKTGPKTMDEVQVYFTQGKISKIAINHYQ